MKILAGTSRGVYAIDTSTSGSASAANDAANDCVLESRGVREVVAIEGRTFAGTADGILVSDDAGATWTDAGLGGREIWQIRSGGGDVVYAGTSPAGLFRSDDLGVTWSEIDSFADLPEATDWGVPLDPPLPGRARALVVDSNDPDRIWVGVEVGGLARTTDGGETWKVALPGDNPDIHMLFAHPGQPGTIFVSTGYGRSDHIAEELEGNAGVFRSSDYGETWEYAWVGVTPRYSRPMCIDQRAPYPLTVGSAPNAFSSYKGDGGAHAMLFRSDDDGNSWHSLGDQAHSPSTANFHGLIVDPEVLGGVLVGTDTGELWRVSAEGVWTLLAEGLPAVLSISA